MAKSLFPNYFSPVSGRLEWVILNQPWPGCLEKSILKRSCPGCGLGLAPQQEQPLHHLGKRRQKLNWVGWGDGLPCGPGVCQTRLCWSRSLRTIRELSRGWEPSPFAPLLCCCLSSSLACGVAAAALPHAPQPLLREYSCSFPLHFPGHGFFTYFCFKPQELQLLGSKHVYNMKHTCICAYTYKHLYKRTRPAHTHLFITSYLYMCSQGQTQVFL